MHLRSKEKSVKIYDDPDPGSADRETITYLNTILEKNPDYSLPLNIQKVIDYEIKLEYIIPKRTALKKSFKPCIEILDSIIFNALHFHFIIPQIVIENKTVARGIFIPGNQNIPILPLYLTVSPEIKCSILKLSQTYSMDLMVELGKLLEDILFTVSNGKDTLQHSMPLSTKQISNEYKKKKELKLMENINNKEKAEKLRKQRQKELEMYLSLKKAEMTNLENEELKKQEEIKQQENKKMMEAEEKKKKEFGEKKNRIEE